jgi:hypothetical protein
MNAETAEIQSEYGVTRDLRYSVDRMLDRVFSGAPRRLHAMKRTLDIHNRSPELAFDGELSPVREMLRNCLIANRKLV